MNLDLLVQMRMNLKLAEDYIRQTNRENQRLAAENQRLVNELNDLKNERSQGTPSQD